MQNINMTTSKDGKTLTIKVDLTQEIGLSTSGKNMKVASTGGNQIIPGKEQEGIKIGLNIYKPAPANVQQSLV